MLVARLLVVESLAQAIKHHPHLSTFVERLRERVGLPQFTVEIGKHQIDELKQFGVSRLRGHQSILGRAQGFDLGIQRLELDL